MRITIKAKLLVAMLALAIIPLAIVGFISVNDAKSLGMGAYTEAKELGAATLEDSKAAMVDLGEKIISNKAKAVASQMAVYIRDHPEMTMRELQVDPAFMKLAVQPVGETGYTYIIDAVYGEILIHPSAPIVNKTFHIFEKSVPPIYEMGLRLIEDPECNDVKTYYDWPDPETGVVKPKYVYHACVSEPTADGVVFSVASSTYIDEFSRPIVAIEEKVNTSIASTLATIKKRTEGLSTQNTIVFISIVTLIIASIVAIVFANSISAPVRKLTKAANEISKGNPKVKIPKIKSNDEIRDLGESLESALAGLAFLLDQAKGPEKKSKKAAPKGKKKR